MEEIKEITEAGIGEDYKKTFGPLNLLLRTAYADTETPRIKRFAKERFTKHGYQFRKYEEWFPREEFRYVVTNQNRATIGKLNQIVNELNRMIETGEIVQINEDPKKHRALQLYNEAMRTIMGPDPKWKDFDFREVLLKGKINEYFST